MKFIIDVFVAYIICFSYPVRRVKNYKHNFMHERKDPFSVQIKIDYKKELNSVKLKSHPELSFLLSEMDSPQKI